MQQLSPEYSLTCRDAKIIWERGRIRKLPRRWPQQQEGSVRVWRGPSRMLACLTAEAALVVKCWGQMQLSQTFGLGSSVSSEIQIPGFWKCEDMSTLGLHPHGNNQLDYVATAPLEKACLLQEVRISGLNPGPPDSFLHFHGPGGHWVCNSSCQLKAGTLAV